MRTPLTILAVLALGLAACGGGAEGDAATPDGDPASVEADGERGDGEDAGGESDAADTGESGDDGDDADESDGETSGDDVDLAAMFSGLEPAAAKVTYRLEGDFTDDPSLAPGLDELTIVQDPPRFATAISLDEGEMRTIVDAGASTTCFREDGAWECLRFDLGEGEPEDVVDEAFGGLPTFEDLDEEHQPDRVERTTVVGREAVCLYYDGEVAAFDEAVDVEVCFDANAAMLLRSSGSYGEGSAFSMEAIAFDTPTDADFELPAEPTEVGDLFGDLEGLEDLEDLEGFDPGQLGELDPGSVPTG